MAKKKTPTPELEYIAAGLRDRVVPIADVTRDPHNCKKHGDADLPGIAASLAEFGQVRTILADRETKLIIAGNGTHEAAERLGWEFIAVDWCDLPPDRARAFAFVDNRTAQLSAWDALELAGYLETVAETTDALYDALRLADLAQTPDDSLPDAVGVPDKFAVIVTVSDEAAQKRLYEFMQAHGYQDLRLITQ